MKGLVKVLGLFTMIGAGAQLGINAGEWLWKNVLKDQADVAKAKLTKINGKEGA